MAVIPADQVPGIHRRRVGGMVVTALNDGLAVASFDVMRGVTAAEGEAVLRQRFRPVPPTITFNAYLVQDGTRNVLIDTGGGSHMGPVAGRMLGNLRAAGLAPDDIDAIVLTHLHVDHVGGMTDAAGAAVFVRAEVFVPEAEAAFWLDPAREAAAPDAMKPAFAVAQRAVAACGERVRRFAGGEPVPGIRAESLRGHTPGHTGYRLHGEDGGLLIWGDVVHVPDVQSRHPEATMVFDVEPELAIATRRRVFEMAAAERLLVAGMHMQFPGFSHVARAAEGYELIPAMWTPTL